MQRSVSGMERKNADDVNQRPISSTWSPLLYSVPTTSPSVDWSSAGASSSASGAGTGAQGPGSGLNSWAAPQPQPQPPARHPQFGKEMR
mmetsp:Transcript_29356/g.91947  ORF Transcript_29356/g.91947 Transcript_29356/m.91947 type:complete len:89 (+) Transcript_29356:605-871(+)